MRNKLLAILLPCLICSLWPITTWAQDVVKVKPVINYTASPATYEIAGLTVSGVDDYDENILLSLSGLQVGQQIIFPKADGEITLAIKNYWAQGLFSDVSITADSIIGNKIYLNIALQALPRISKVHYHGVKKTEREDLEDRLNLKEGNQVSTNTLDRAKYVVKKFFEDKGYKNTEIEIVQRDDSLKKNQVSLDLYIDKNEKIKVHKIYFTGVSDPKRINKLKSAMKKTKEVNRFKNLLRSKKFIEEKYSEDKDKIIEKYNEWGYRDAYITADSTQQFDDKHIDVYIHVDEGDKYYLRNISWAGNTIYTTDALNKSLGMQRGDVYNQTLLEKRLKTDQDAIANEYYNNGYVFSQVRPFEINVVGDSIDIEVRIIENNKAYLNRINISGNDRVYEEVVRRELRTKPGDLFNRESIMRSLQDIQQMGNFDPESLEPKITPNQEDGTVDITYPLSPKSTDQIELSAGWGQTGVTGRIALRFTNFAIQNFLKKEGRSLNILPQGLGQTVEVSAQTNGTYYQQYSISFLDPWFGRKRPNQLSLSLFYSKQTDVNSNYYSNYYNNYYSYLYGYGTSSNYYNIDNYYDPDKYVKILGASVGWGTRLRWPDDYFTFSTMLTYQRYMLKAWQYFIMTDGNCNNLNFTLSLNRYSSDQMFFPRRGSDLSMSVSLTPPYSLWDGKDYAALARNPRSSTYQAEMQEKFRWVEYHKWKFQFKTYTALTNGVKCPVLATRTEFGLLGYYNRHKQSPFETFYVGGDGMSGYSTGYATETIGLRGYDNGQLTPYGSEAYAYTRLGLELRYPLMLSSTSIYALAFMEGGNSWTSVKKFNLFDMKRSAGVGVRLFLPMIGLMGIDWAYGFDKVFGEKGGGQFHFIIGREL